MWQSYAEIVQAAHAEERRFIEVERLGDRAVLRLVDTDKLNVLSAPTASPRRPAPAERRPTPAAGSCANTPSTTWTPRPAPRSKMPWPISWISSAAT